MRRGLRPLAGSAQYGRVQVLQRQVPPHLVLLRRQERLCGRVGRDALPQRGRRGSGKRGQPPGRHLRHRQVVDAPPGRGRDEHSARRALRLPRRLRRLGDGVDGAEEGVVLQELRRPVRGLGTPGGGPDLRLRAGPRDVGAELGPREEGVVLQQRARGVRAVRVRRERGPRRPGRSRDRVVLPAPVEALPRAERGGGGVGGALRLCDRRADVAQLLGRSEAGVVLRAPPPWLREERGGEPVAHRSAAGGNQ
mmetsp:Transcript_99931/g.271672  ORF Transcript_99931/g.271672 Transcript_99931/m.271672 type:complete len:251 (+) Transcript_99931:404-1156(+)